jgi:hypothetical protein
MAVYPDVLSLIPATLPIVHSTNQAVLKTEFETGVEVRRLVRSSVRRNIKINYAPLRFAASNELRRFYEDREGSFKRFVFYFPQRETYVNELVGVVTDISYSDLKLPSLNADTFTLKRDGVALTEGVGFDWIFSPAAGVEDGEDMAELQFVPALGERYTFDFTGRLKVVARFSENPFMLTDVKELISSSTVELVGLEPELK